MNPMRLLLATCMLVSCIGAALGQNSTDTNKTDAGGSQDFDGWKHASSVEDLSEFKNGNGGYTFNVQPCFYAVYTSGGTVADSKSNKDDDPKVHVVSSKKNDSNSMNVKFDSGKAVISDSDKHVWKLDKSGNLQWTDKDKDATKFDVFVNEEEPDVLFFMADEQVLSIVSGSEKDFLGGYFKKDVDIWAAGLLSPFSLFTSASKDASKCVSEVVLNQRREALRNNLKPSPLFLAYDYGESVPLGMSFFDVKDMVPSTIQDLYAFIRTVAWVVVVGEPGYKDTYYSLGYALPQEFGIYDIIKNSGLDDESMGKLVQYMQHEVRWGGFSTPQDELEVIMFMSLLLEYALREDMDADKPFFMDDSKSPTDIMKNSFKASATLAFMTSNSTILEKLKYVDPMQMDNSQDAYMGKDSDGRYWFADLVDSNNDDINNEKTFVELALLRYLRKTKYVSEVDESNTETSVGSGVASAVMKELSPLLSNFNVSGLAEYSLKPGFTGAIDVSKEVCSKGTSLPFCLMTGAMSQANGLGSAYRSSFIANATTQTTTMGSIKFQEYISRILEQLDTESVTQIVVNASTELQEYMKKSVYEIADTIDKRTLEGIEKQNKLVSENIVELGSYLDAVNSFDYGVRQEKFDKLREVALKGMMTAMTLKDDLSDLLDDLLSKAHEEQSIQAVFNSFEAVIGIVAMLIPTQKVVSEVEGAAVDATSKIAKDIFSASQETSTGASTASGIQGIIMNAFNLKDIGDVSNYIDNGLNDELEDAFGNAGNVIDRLVDIRSAINPILNDGEKLDDEALQQHSNAFLNAYKSYSSPILPSTADKMATAYSSIIDGLCTLIDRDAYPPCVVGKPLPSEVFGNLAEAIEYGENALSVLADLATTAVSKQQAKQIKDNAENMDITPDKSDIEENKESRQKFWRQWQRRANYSTILSKSVDMSQRVRLLEATLVYCNYETYQEGGEPTDFCKGVFAGETLDKEDIRKAVDYKSDTQISTKDITDALIPTLPEESGQTAFINIGRLMAGETVTFRLPGNQTWLKKHNWLPNDVDIEKDIITIQDIDLYLVPPYSTYMEEETSPEVKLKFTGTSDLGPAMKNKKVVIPSYTFSTSYTMEPADSDACDGGTIKDWSADQCKGLPVACQRSKGGGPYPDMYPSLFSTFEVSAVLEENSGGLMQFGSLATQLYLHADAKVRVIKNVKYESVDDPLAEASEAGSWEKYSSDEGSESMDIGSLANETLPTDDGSTADSVGTGSISDDDNFSVGDEDGASSSGNSSVGDGEEDGSGSASMSVGDKDASSSASTSSSGSSTGSANETGSSTSVERKLAEKADGRCCDVGQYYDLSSSDCLDCPPGSISQMGGLYCIYVTEEDFKASVKGVKSDEE